MYKDIPYIGCEISLISAACIRYKGTLTKIDPKEQTVTLSEVKSFGTENRPGVKMRVRASDEIY